MGLVLLFIDRIISFLVTLGIDFGLVFVVNLHYFNSFGITCNCKFVMYQ